MAIKKLKFKQIQNFNYTKIYERSDGRVAVYLRDDFFRDTYYLGVITYDLSGLGITDVVVKKGLDKSDGLKALTKLKKKMESQSRY